MTLYFEIILLLFTFMCLGYVTSRPGLCVTLLGIISWLISGFSTYIIKGNPIIPSLEMECTTLASITVWSTILIAGIILYGSPFLIGYYMGKVVNNVEKYQKKDWIVTIVL